MTIQDLLMYASFITLSWLSGYGFGLSFKALKQFVEKVKW